MKLLKSKKGDGMSLNIVVVAVLALVVLVVLLAVFGSKMRAGSKGQDEAQANLMKGVCSNSTYYCEVKGVACEGSGSERTGNFIDCPSDSGHCCPKKTN